MGKEEHDRDDAKVIKIEQYKNRDPEFSKRMRVLNGVRNGELFIYPTDTIYGLGCNALDSNAVTKLRKAKQNHAVALSVIAPSKEWVQENCHVTKEAEQWLEKLPGPHTLMLKLKNPAAVAPEVHVGTGKIGVRIPNHWFNKVPAALDIPVVVSSANVSGKAYMTKLEDLDRELRENVDFILDEGPKDNQAGQVVNLAK
jgi:L-threonylcarbamoyladenylate synthase